MVRQIIRIDEDKCDGCEICVSTCHEGAIDIVDGKAKLTRENFCDGLGECLPNCPADAISFEKREAPAFDAEAVKRSQKKKKNQNENITKIPHIGGCSSSKFMELGNIDKKGKEENSSQPVRAKSRLNQWPCQIKLVPAQAPFYDNAKLLIAADCTAYAYANIHENCMEGRISIIGCPKLDDIDYTKKLTEIIRDNNIKSVTVVRMEVPCCGGIQAAVENALRASRKFIPWQVVTISREGEIID